MTRPQIKSLRQVLLVIAVALPAVLPPTAQAQRRVTFPPAKSPPAPAIKSPPRTATSGEETMILTDPGPTMRKTQIRTPPPPTNLTVMYKLIYGETLQYTYLDTGKTVKFEQWQSFRNDGAELMRQANLRLADGNNYQYATMPLDKGKFDPVDIPLLYMTGDYDFEFTKTEVEKLRKFLMDGGTIMFNAARGRDEFSRAVARQMKRVFPRKRFMKMSLDHPVYNAKYRINTVTAMISGTRSMEPPTVYSIDIGTRAAAILVPGGMGASWGGHKYHPQGKHIMGEPARRLGVNIIAYVLGSTEYGRFLAQRFPVYEGYTRPGDVVRFALVRYAGSWDVNPGIQNTILQGLHENTGIHVDYTPQVVDLADPHMGDYPLVFMTGHYDFELSNDQIENLQNYIARGGTLVASAAAGLKPFDLAFRREIKRVFPDNDLIRIPPSHEFFAMGWNPIGQVNYTPALLRDNPTLQYPVFYGIFVDKRPVVLYTPYDLLSALNRESNAYAKGLTSDDAMRVAANIFTFTLSH